VLTKLRFTWYVSLLDSSFCLFVYQKSVIKLLVLEIFVFNLFCVLLQTVLHIVIYVVPVRRMLNTLSELERAKSIAVVRLYSFDIPHIMLSII
jgi:hypothetical protein